LSTLDDNFVKEKIERIFASNNKLKVKFDASVDFKRFSKSKEHTEMQKRIRKELRAIYGVFNDETKGRDALLQRLRSTKSDAERKGIVRDLLATHASTKERIDHYDAVYSEICSRIAPKAVIDLGCGLNPLAYEYFVEHGCKPTVLASDLSADDMRFLDGCFSALKIPGKTIALDLTKPSDIARLKTLKGDVTFMFKLLDSLEESKRHISYNIFDNITTPWIVASFPTKSLGGKKNIARAGRSWFERLLARKELRWETFSVENELFYVIQQS
jgi:16S rRNA (guanine(1405)-N(7))-methyltransferase